MNEVRCEECNSLFKQNRYWQKFCSPACRTKQFLRIQKEYVALGRTVKEQNRTHRDLFAA